MDTSTTVTVIRKPASNIKDINDWISP